MLLFLYNYAYIGFPRFKSGSRGSKSGSRGSKAVQNLILAKTKIITLEGSHLTCRLVSQHNSVLERTFCHSFRSLWFPSAFVEFAWSLFDNCDTETLMTAFKSGTGLLFAKKWWDCAQRDEKNEGCYQWCRRGMPGLFHSWLRIVEVAFPYILPARHPLWIPHWISTFKNIGVWGWTK